MNSCVIITCAVTGDDDIASRHPNVPVTPAQIAQAAIDAATADAIVAHILVRDPKTGKPSREVALYREVVERIRGSDVILNLATGPGARFVPHDDATNAAEEGLYLWPTRERVGPNAERRRRNPWN
jgi:uncharacterized protein (DUF849 family)